MPEVKYIWVRLSETGAAEVREQLKNVAGAADSIKDRVKIRVEVDGAARAQAQIAATGDAANRAGFRAAQGMESYRRSLENLRKTLRDVNAEVDAGSQKSGGGIGGFFGRIFSGLAGVNVPLGPLGSAPLPVVAAGALIPGPVFLGIVPLLAAAGAGVASFGALAFPTFQKVAASIGLTGDKLRDLPPGLRGAVQAVQSVTSTFSGLAKVIAPQVFPIIKDLAPGIRQLIGDMGPFAHAVAPVLDQLAKSFSRFTMSSGFKQFLDQFLKLSGPALLTIGQGIGHVAIAIGKLLQGMINPSGLAMLRFLFRAIGDLAAGLGNLIHWLFLGGAAIGRFVMGSAHFLQSLKSWWDAAMGGIGMALDTAVRAIGRFFGADIPHWISVGIAWFKSLPGRIVGALGNLGGLLVGVGRSIISGLISGVQSMLGPLGSVLGSIAGFITSHKGPPEKDKMLLYPAGMLIMLGLGNGMKAGAVRLGNVLRDLGIQIADKLMDAFMSRNDKRADAAGAQIAAIIKARLEQIRSVIIGVAQAQVAWASIVSAATGPAFTSPHWVPGTPGTPATFSHTGVPTGGTPATPGHWAGGQAPPTGAQLLRNLRLDLGRLKAFAHVMARLRRMGLDPVLWQQILAAGPDQGYQIAEAILDAGRGEIRALNATERQIYQTGVGLGRTAAKSQFGGGITYVINFNGFIAGNPRAIARELQKLLADLKRHNGGQALGLA